MSVRHSPAVESYVCDRCRVEFDRTGHGGTHGRLERWGRAVDGSVGGGTSRIDLCADCDIAFTRFIREGRKAEDAP